MFRQGRPARSPLRVAYKDLARLPTIDAIPLLEEKFAANLATRFPASQAESIMELCLDRKPLESTPVNEFMETFVI